MVDSVTKVFLSPATSQQYQKGSEEKQKEHQFIAQVEGEFYCTYLIDEMGNKRLISKVLMVQMEKEEICLDGSAFENIKNVISHNIKNSAILHENKKNTNKV